MKMRAFSRLLLLSVCFALAGSPFTAVAAPIDSNAAAPETSTQMIVYPTGETKTIQLDDQTDPVELPVMTVQSPAWVEERTWTNSDGKSLRARLQFADDTTAYLELNGRIVPYPLEKLSPLDRQVAKQCSSTALPILVPVKVR